MKLKRTFSLSAVMLCCSALMCLSTAARAQADPSATCTATLLTSAQQPITAALPANAKGFEKVVLTSTLPASQPARTLTLTVSVVGSTAAPQVVTVATLPAVSNDQSGIGGQVILPAQAVVDTSQPLPAGFTFTGQTTIFKPSVLPGGGQVVGLLPLTFPSGWGQ